MHTRNSKCFNCILNLTKKTSIFSSVGEPNNIKGIDRLNIFIVSDALGSREVRRLNLAAKKCLDFLFIVHFLFLQLAISCPCMWASQMELFFHWLQAQHNDMDINGDDNDKCDNMRMMMFLIIL